MKLSMGSDYLGTDVPKLKVKGVFNTATTWKPSVLDDSAVQQLIIINAPFQVYNDSCD